MALFGAKKTKDDEIKTDPKTEAPVAMKDLYSASATKTTKGGVIKKKTGLNHEATCRLLIKPLVTEKATNLSSENKYVFVVSKKANKIMIVKAIEATYGVKPVAVNIINRAGKMVARGRITGQRKDWKKAIITLKPGETIKIYEGV